VIATEGKPVELLMPASQRGFVSGPHHGRCCRQNAIHAIGSDAVMSRRTFPGVEPGLHLGERKKE
jgi:hypothetical protein